MRKTFRCDHCGKRIKIEEDLDCMEVKMFESRNINPRYASDEFTPTTSRKYLYFCGKCMNLLNCYFVESWKCEQGAKLVEICDK